MGRPDQGFKMDTKNMIINPFRRKAIKITGNILFILVIITTGLMILSKFNFGNLKVLTVKSGSMNPAIFVGSVTFVLPAEDYNEGDIITFRTQGEKELVTHRIMEVDNSMDQPYYRTKGDANNIADSYRVPKNGVAGRALFSVPFLGYVIEFMKTPVGLIFLVVVPGTIITYEEIRKIKKEWLKLREKRKNKTENKTESVKINLTPVVKPSVNYNKGKIRAAISRYQKNYRMKKNWTALP